MSKGLSNITELSFVNDIKKIVEQGRRAAYGAVNSVMINTYWHIGKRIVEQEQNGKERVEYGKQLIEILSKELTIAYGKGFSKRNLQYFRAFYLTYNDIEIVQSRLHNLTWTHILTTLRVEILMPPVGCAAFTWDGIYLGATASRQIRNSLIWALLAFVLTWFALNWLLPAPSASFACPSLAHPDTAVAIPSALATAATSSAVPDPGSASGASALPLHLLLAAYFAHLAARTIYLSLRWKDLRNLGAVSFVSRGTDVADYQR